MRSPRYRLIPDSGVCYCRIRRPGVYASAIDPESGVRSFRMRGTESGMCTRTRNDPLDHHSLHEGVGFSIHSLNRTGSPCLLGCHDCIAACAGARAQNVCALNIIPCLRPHAIQYLSITARLNGAPLISAYGAGSPKVIWPREGHAGK